MGLQWHKGHAVIKCDGAGGGNSQRLCGDAISPSNVVEEVVHGGEGRVANGLGGKMHTAPNFATRPSPSSLQT